MNYISLMVLGLSGISVYSDAIFVRMLIATGCLLVASVIAGGVVAAIRLFTDLATPGWATTVEFGIIIIVFQAVVSTLTALLLLLSSRSQRSIVPALDYGRFVDSCTELTSRAPTRIGGCIMNRMATLIETRTNRYPRWAVPAFAVALFAALYGLHAIGQEPLYRAILIAWGIGPYDFPFLDIHGELSAIECWRRGSMSM